MKRILSIAILIKDMQLYETGCFSANCCKTLLAVTLASDCDWDRRGF
jgi:hypothetical protein